MAYPFCPVCQQTIVEKLGRRLFGNAGTQGEQPVDSGTHVITFLPSSVTSDEAFMIYDFATGAYAIYPCAPFAHGGPAPTPARASIAPFWTAVTSVYVQNQPHVLAIQRGSGAFALYRFSEDGTTLGFVRGTETPGFGVPFPFGFLQITPFPFLDSLHYLEYDIVSGQAAVKRIEALTPDPVTIRTLALGQGRIGFTPFLIQDDARVHFYSYDLNNGTVELHRFDADDVTSVWRSDTLLAPGWTDLVPFRLSDGSRFLLLHSRLHNLLRIYRIRNNGQGLEYVYTKYEAGRGPFAFAAFRLLKDKRTYYLRYRWALPLQQATIEVFHCE